MKKIIRLTEGDLHKIIKESVNRALMESNPNYRGGGGINGRNASKYFRQ